jgi:predicted TIM-barrel fold metal-dependent hydrolase
MPLARGKFRHLGASAGGQLGRAARKLSVRAAFIVVAALATVLAAAFPRDSARSQSAIPIIDAHTHLIRSLARSNLDQAAGEALRLMERLGVQTAILSPPPFPRVERGIYGLPQLQRAVRDHPDRLAFNAGGESLNLIIQATAPEATTRQAIQHFTREAVKIAQSGAAGFGELAAEHFSFRVGRHPYESARPDHPLLLALADIAAQHAMPIELHMEAVPRDMPFPPAHSGPPNPASLKENITAFERLLEHNPKARVVWIHAGWDLTGERTVALMRALLRRHANLYMSVKSDRAGTRSTDPFGPDGQVKPDWIEMLRAFPDRFVIGSDQFFDQGPERIERGRKFIDGLPPDLARGVALENVKHLYRLPTAR